MTGILPKNHERNDQKNGCVFCLYAHGGRHDSSASKCKAVASYDATTYNVNIVQKFSRKKHDFSLVDKNNDGKISSTEVNFGKIMYNFSAYKPYGKIKHPVVKKYYTTGTKTIKKKVKGKTVTTKKTVKGKTQYKYYIKNGSKTVFSNKKSNGYNVASANPKNNLTYVYASKSGTASVKDLAYGAYTVTESGSAPANVIQTSKKASIVPAKKTAYKTKTENRVMDGKYVKVNYHRYGKKTVTFNNTFAYLTVNGTGLLS